MRTKIIKAIPLFMLLCLWGLPNVVSAQVTYSFRLPPPWASTCSFPVQAPNCHKIEIRSAFMRVPVGGTFEFDVRIDGKFSGTRRNEFGGSAVCGVSSLPNPHMVERSVNLGGAVKRYVGWYYPGSWDRDVPNPRTCFPDYGSSVRIHTHYMNEFGCITMKRISGARTYRNNREFDYLKVNGTVTSVRSLSGGTDPTTGKSVRILDDRNNVIYEGFWPEEVEIRRNGTNISTNDSTTLVCNVPPKCPDQPERSKNCIRYKLGGNDTGEWTMVCDDTNKIPQAYVESEFLSSSQRKMTFNISTHDGFSRTEYDISGNDEFPRVEQGYSVDCNLLGGWRPLPVPHYEQIGQYDWLNRRCSWQDGATPVLKCSSCPEYTEPIRLVADEAFQGGSAAIGVLAFASCVGGATNPLLIFGCGAFGGGLAGGAAAIFGGVDEGLCRTQTFPPGGRVNSTTDTGFLTNEETESPGNFITVYPNPATDVLTLQMDATAGEEITLELYDMYGSNTVKSTFTAQGGSLEKEMDISGLSAGVYIMKVNTSLGRTFDDRLIVKE